MVNDGEQGRSQYATYVKERLTGFEGERAVRSRPRLDDADFPDFAATQVHMSSRNMPQPGLHRPHRVEGLAGRGGATSPTCGRPAPAARWRRSS